MADFENRDDQFENEEDSTIYLTDVDGNENAFEMLGEVEYEGVKYGALLPLDMEEEDEDSEDIGILLLRMTEEGDEMFFDTVDDDALLDKVFAKFEEENPDLFGEDDEEAED